MGAETELRSRTDAVEDVSTRAVERRYDRIAWLYDFYDAPMNKLGGLNRRRRVVEQARGSILEVGIGTGVNLELYPPTAEVTGIDISTRMLARARRRAAMLGTQVRLLHGDVERLPFSDATFDTVLATCVFCSVADPVQGLREVRRVVRPNGRVLLLEHIRPENVVLGWLADVVSPLTKRLMGPELNRRIEENVARSGLCVAAVHREGIWREVEAYPRQRRRQAEECRVDRKDERPLR